MSNLLCISRWIFYVRSLLSEFASLPLMHPPVSAWLSGPYLCIVSCTLEDPLCQGQSFASMEATISPVLQVILSDPGCNLALKDQYLSLCCLTTRFSRTQHIVIQWTERLNICHSFHKSIWWSGIQINIGFLSVSILNPDGGFGLRQINCSKIYNYVILTMVWFNKQVRKKKMQKNLLMLDIGRRKGDIFI